MMQYEDYRRANEMRANVIHTDLNPCGGAELLSLGTIRALIEMNVDVELTTAKVPNISRLKNAFGEERVGRLFEQIKRINMLGKLPISINDELTINLTRRNNDHKEDHRDYDFVLNTHGDILPYVLPTFSGQDTITYCHYPVALDMINSRSDPYLRYLANLGLIDNKIVDIDTETRSIVWRKLREHYLLMLRNSMVLANSNFSKEAILMALETENLAPNSQPLIIPPPVDVEEFRTALFSTDRRDYILVLSRIHPSKMLENAIELASLLKRKRVGKGMIIVGNLLNDDRITSDYYHKILDMVRRFAVLDYVTIETNVQLTRLESFMRSSKVYFHPSPGEPFGISIVEAMSAGLIPVVPDTGGHTEFVSKNYQFHSLKEAPGIISAALHATQDERLRVSNSVMGFSTSHYVGDLQRVITEMLTTAGNTRPTPLQRTNGPGFHQSIT